MLPYLLLLLLIALLGFLLCELKQSRRRDLIFLCVISLVMVAMSALRADSVGIDYKPYAQYFQSVCEGGLPYLFGPTNEFKDEMGYSLLNYAISLVTQNTYVFMGAVAVVSVGLRAVLVYRYSSSVWISFFVFASYGFFGYTICTIRQEIAIGIFLFAIRLIQDKKLIPYLLLVLLAATFHVSLLFMLPVYFIARIPLNWKTLSVYGALTLIVLIFSQPILNFVTRFIFQNYTEGSYYLRGRDINTAVIPVLTFAAAMLFKKRLLERNPKNVVLLNLSCYASILFILTLKHFVFQRVALIFLPAVLLLVPEILRCMDVDPAKREQLEQIRQRKAERTPNKKHLLTQKGRVKQELADQTRLYYTTIAAILFSGLIYQLFLLNANRLLLVPYVFFFT